MRADAITTTGRALNLLIPGGGLILIGCELSGVLVALWFTATATFAIVAGLLIPDDVGRTWRGLAIGLTLGTYLGSQIRFAQTVRHQRARSRQDARNAALRRVRRALQTGRLDEAWQTLQPLLDQADADLSLAHRVAQVLTARGNEPAARAAWRRVRRLDRHRLYDREARESERILAEPRPDPSRFDDLES